MPKARAAVGFAVTATKCSSGFFTPLALNQSIARAALASDSVVVNDLEEMMTSVSSGSSPSSAPVIACASTFEAKRIVRRPATPARDSTASLGPQSLPHETVFVDWTFSGVVKDLDRLSAYLADRLGWTATDTRRPRLTAHLAAQAKPDAAGARLDIPRKSAVLVWRLR